MATTTVRTATSQDAACFAEIYNHFVLTTAISFEEAAIPAEEMAARMGRVAAASLPWLVAQRDGRIVGYAYASNWKERHAYRFTAETTVYVAPEHGGLGIGSALYGALFPRLSEAGRHAAIAVIALPNAPSVALHEKFGMTKVAHYREVGFKFGRWHDVGDWQRVD